MKETTLSIIENNLSENNLTYLSNEIKIAIEKSVSRIKHGGKIVVCGNGGSASDSEHIVGELLKSFILPRKLSDVDKAKFIDFGDDGKLLAEKLQYGIPAISLSGAESVLTAVINDNGAEMMFAQQTFGLVNYNDVFIGISTSGNAKTVKLAMEVAKVKGTFSIALSGNNGGRLRDIADVNLIVNCNQTYKIQEKHVEIYHLYCMCLENELFGE